VRKKHPPSESSSVSEVEPLALPEDEIRRLVLLTTARYKIEPFIKQLIKLMDNLKVGQTKNIAKLTRPGRDEFRAMLFAALTETVNEGRTMAAYHTTYQAALYAYENSLNHLLAFHEYLDWLRQHKPGNPSPT
jgi:choline dehydrogenase-like flavoprotein